MPSDIKPLNESARPSSEKSDAALTDQPKSTETDSRRTRLQEFKQKLVQKLAQLYRKKLAKSRHRYLTPTKEGA